MAGLQVRHLECLGAETIRVWRFFRVFRAVRQWWLRTMWKDATRALYVVQVAPIPSLADQCAASGAMLCVSCRTPLRLPTIPRDGVFGTTAFGCGVCHAYYFMTTEETVDDGRYVEIRRRLAEKGSR